LNKKKKKKKNSLFKRRILQLKFLDELFNKFASVCPRAIERAFGNEVLLEYLSLAFRNQTHICIGPSCHFKMV